MGFRSATLNVEIAQGMAGEQASRLGSGGPRRRFDDGSSSLTSAGRTTAPGVRAAPLEVAVAEGTARERCSGLGSGA